MTQGVILFLVCFTLVNIYFFVQNYSQNTYFQEVRRRTLTFIKNKDNDATDTAKSSSGGLTQVNEILKRLQTLETKRNVDLTNKTETVLDRLMNKFWPRGQQPNVVDEDKNLKWLNRTNAKGFANYGDGTCPVTTARSPSFIGTCCVHSQTTILRAIDFEYNAYPSYIVVSSGQAVVVLVNPLEETNEAPVSWIHEGNAAPGRPTGPSCG